MASGCAQVPEAEFPDAIGFCGRAELDQFPTFLGRMSRAGNRHLSKVETLP